MVSPARVLVYSCLLLGVAVGISHAMSTSENNGGFKMDSSSFAESSTCNIERREFMDENEFHRHYYMKKPVIITGATKNWFARQLWTRSNLLKVYGKNKFLLQTGSGGSEQNQAASLNDILGGSEGHDSARFGAAWKEYVESTPAPTLESLSRGDYADGIEAPGYIFDDRFLMLKKRRVDYNTPEIFNGSLKKHIKHRYFSLGPSYSGTFFHQHGSALSVTLFGRKRWFLMPDQAYRRLTEERKQSSIHFVAQDYVHPVEWLLRYYEPFYKGKVKECVVEEGSMLYIPEMWAHAVINIGETVGVAFELNDSSQHTLPVGVTTIPDLEQEDREEFMDAIEKKPDYDRDDDGTSGDNGLGGNGEDDDEDGGDDDVVCPVSGQYGGVKVKARKAEPELEQEDLAGDTPVWREADENDDMELPARLSQSHGYDSPFVSAEDELDEAEGEEEEEEYDDDAYENDPNTYEQYSVENPISEQAWLEELSSS